MLKRALVLVALGFASPAAAQDAVANFYRGKQLQLRVGLPAGSGYDIAGRLIAAHWGAHIPGNPAIVVQNVPGAGSLTLANQIANTAPRDGTVVGLVTNGVPTAPMLTPETARFDIARFGWIGSPAAETMMVMLWRDAPVKTLEDLYTKETLVGAAQLGTATMDNPLVANAALGTKFKIIPGYDGTNAIDLAMERGEIMGHAGIGYVTAKARNEQWMKEGKVRIVAQYGFQRNPEIPDVPLFPLPNDPVKRDMISVMFARQDFGRPLIAPPDVPADRLAALRRAYDETMRDPEFLRDAQRATMDIHPLSGEALERLAAGVKATSPEAVARLRDVLDPNRMAK
jgi:tripartite-type tricarboxylate transporter receptor subunit TctC